jgi:hypothetical protein
MNMQTPRKKRIRLSPGKLIGVRLEDGGYCFGIVAAGEDVAFFKLHSFDAALPVNDILSCPVMFRVHVAKSSYREENWDVLEKHPLPPGLGDISVYWNQPVGDNQLNLMGLNKFRPISIDEARKLERAAVWFAPQIEDRLSCNLDGNRSEEEIWLNTMTVYDPVTFAEIEEVQLGLPDLP